MEEHQVLGIVAQRVLRECQDVGGHRLVVHMNLYITE